MNIVSTMRRWWAPDGCQVTRAAHGPTLNFKSTVDVRRAGGLRGVGMAALKTELLHVVEKYRRGYNIIVCDVVLMLSMAGAGSAACLVKNRVLTQAGWWRAAQGSGRMD